MRRSPISWRTNVDPPSGRDIAAQYRTGGQAARGRRRRAHHRSGRSSRRRSSRGESNQNTPVAYARVPRELVFVTSDKMQKTRVVTVERRLSHAKYGKFLTSRKKYKAHDEKNEYKLGDRVLIVEARPLSRDKRWRVEKLIERPQEA